jgi:predicted RNA binding protein YcfA (HicA-like mRNA interferase family)
MPKLPRVNARQTLRAIERDGWEIVRQSGSHAILRHPSKPGIVVIPMHTGRALKAGTLRGILAQAGVSVDRFLELL